MQNNDYCKYSTNEDEYLFKAGKIDLIDSWILFLILQIRTNKLFRMFFFENITLKIRFIQTFELL